MRRAVQGWVRASCAARRHGDGVMKNQLFPSLFSLALAIAVPASLAAADTSSAPVTAAAVASPIANRSVKAQLNSPRLHVGSSRMEVLRALGRPQFEATPEVWVYEGYHVENPAAGQEKLTHLVVRFDGRRVVRTELASSEYVADLRQPQVDPHRALVLK